MKARKIEPNQLLEDLFNSYIREIHGRHQRIGEEQRKRGRYTCIHLELGHFLRVLKQAMRLYRGSSPKFLDVGCGIGQKVLTASLLGCDPDGIEVQPVYVAEGNKILKRYRYGLGGRIKLADALAFKGYDQYDIIYFFRPMESEEMMEKIEGAILEGAKPGAVLISVFSTCGLQSSSPSGWIRRDRDILQKKP